MHTHIIESVERGHEPSCRLGELRWTDVSGRHDKCRHPLGVIIHAALHLEYLRSGAVIVTKKWCVKAHPVIFACLKPDSPRHEPVIGIADSFVDRKEHIGATSVGTLARIIVKTPVTVVVIGVDHLKITRKIIMLHLGAEIVECLAERGQQRIVLSETHCGRVLSGGVASRKH